jgi:hypothetical protein
VQRDGRSPGFIPGLFLCGAAALECGIGDAALKAPTPSAHSKAFRAFFL